MSVPPRPALAIIREGNPGHHSRARLERGLRLAPRAPSEPDWVKDIFPARAGDAIQQERGARLRQNASDEWRRVVSALDPQGLLAPVDRCILLDHCVAVALTLECYRDIAINGYCVVNRYSRVKNPATTILQQQRERLKHTVVHLGASPVARDSLNSRSLAHDDDSPFD
jgi:P27 family predicted phage terminase small subunit